VAIPFLGQKPTFAFIVHPRDREDMLRAKCLSILREASSDEADLFARVCNCPPTIVGEIVFGFSPYRGELISIARLPPEVATLRGRQEILQAARVMIDRGARVIGLGALTSPATAGGEWLVEQLPAGVTVTNGNAYTAAVLRQNVVELARALPLDRPPRVAVIGAAGSVGSCLSQLLANATLDLILIGRTTSKVRQVLGSAAPHARFSERLDDAAAADIVVVLTSDPSARLTPPHVRRGAIVIDAAEPLNIPESDAAAWQPHAIVTRGARVRIPAYHSSCDLGVDDPSETFACLAETYLFAREGLTEHSVGAPSAAFAERIERVARRHGVRPSFVAPLSDQENILCSGTSRESPMRAAAAT
jgi:fatty aldehyde-generating acyl-ACP reductase